MCWNCLEMGHTANKCTKPLDKVTKDKCYALHLEKVKEVKLKGSGSAQFTAEEVKVRLFQVSNLTQQLCGGIDVEAHGDDDSELREQVSNIDVRINKAAVTAASAETAEILAKICDEDEGVSIFGDILPQVVSTNNARVKVLKTSVYTNPSLHPKGWKSELVFPDKSRVGAKGPAIFDSGADIVVFPMRYARQYLDAGGKLEPAPELMVEQVSTKVKVLGMINNVTIAIQSPTGGEVLFHNRQVAVMNTSEILLSNVIMHEMGIKPYEVAEKLAARNAEFSMKGKQIFETVKINTAQNCENVTAKVEFFVSKIRDKKDKLLLQQIIQEFKKQLNNRLDNIKELEAHNKANAKTRAKNKRKKQRR